MDIHTRQLRYFMELAKCLNFTKAAINLYIAQPALSQQIAELEKQLGTILFERNSRFVTLTPAGRILQSACPEILSKLERVEQQMQWAQAGLQGSIRIGYHWSFQSFLPRIVQEFRRRYPDVAMEFVCGDFRKLELAQENGDIDLAFSWINRSEMPESNPPSYRILWQDNLCIAVDRNHPFARSGGEYSLLENETFILLDEETSPGFQFMARKAYGEAGYLIKNQTTAREFASILVQVEAGMGVSILPEGMAGASAQATEGIVLIPLKEKCVDFGVLWHENVNNGAVSLFLDLLEKA